MPASSQRLFKVQWKWRRARSLLVRALARKKLLVVSAKLFASFAIQPLSPVEAIVHPLKLCQDSVVIRRKLRCVEQLAPRTFEVASRDKRFSEHNAVVRRVGEVLHAAAEQRDVIVPDGLCVPERPCVHHGQRHKSGSYSSPASGVMLPVRKQAPAESNRLTQRNDAVASGPRGSLHAALSCFSFLRPLYWPLYTRKRLFPSSLTMSRLPL